MGNIEQLLGDLPAAKAAYAQSLQLDRQLQTNFGDTLTVLKDLTISLKRVAEIEKKLGNLTSAKHLQAQSHEIEAKLETF